MKVIKIGLEVFNRRVKVEMLYSDMINGVTRVNCEILKTFKPSHYVSVMEVENTKDGNLFLFAV